MKPGPWLHIRKYLAERFSPFLISVLLAPLASFFLQWKLGIQILHQDLVAPPGLHSRDYSWMNSSGWPIFWDTKSSVAILIDDIPFPSSFFFLLCCITVPLETAA